jgi:hypothetical protein
VIDLSDLNPVPHRAEGWAISPEGLETRSRAELGGPAGPARRRRLPAVAVAAVVVLALVASVLVLQRGGPHQNAPQARSLVDRLAHGEWKSLFDSGLTDAQSVWTGHELIVWGEDAGKVSQGVAYNPRTRKVRPLPDWRLGLRSGAIVRWTGREMLVWGGSDPGQFAMTYSTDGAAYNPRTNRWRAMAPAPFPAGAATATWTGLELVVTNGADALPGAASYDPVTDQWQVLPDPPVSVRLNPYVAAAWDGREVVYTLITFAVPDGRAAMAYDPSTQVWRGLPLPPSNGQSTGIGLAPEARGVRFIGWSAAPGSRPFLHAARLEWEGAQWLPTSSISVHPKCVVRTTPLPHSTAVWCGGADVVGLDLRSGTWRQFPRRGRVLFTSLTWAGHELVGVADHLVVALVPAAR